MSHTIVADLRSDTVTKATPAMRRAMAEAEVGDEIREGDPTAQRLETRAAELTGHEAALFCTSGTMGNLIAFCCHLQRGEEVIAESTSHFLHYESGGIAAIAGAMTRSLPGRGGRVDLAELEAAIRPGTTHNPRTALLVAENTHNSAGGTCLDQAYMRAFGEIGRAHDIPVHQEFLVEPDNHDELLSIVPKGRGGTSHKPLFEYIDEHRNKWNLEHVVVISFTDGYSDFPDEEPNVDEVIFVLSGGHCAPSAMPAWSNATTIVADG